MEKEIRDRWVAALRSGEYEQGEQRFHNETTGRFCCLGVLCDTLSLPTEDESGEDNEIDLMRATGLSQRTLAKLAAMNDGGTVVWPDERRRAFADIADYIEQTVPVS